MDKEELGQWHDDLEKIKELTEAINVRFKTVKNSGLEGSERVVKAAEIYNNLKDIYHQLDRLQSSFYGNQTV